MTELGKTIVRVRRRRQNGTRRRSASVMLRVRETKAARQSRAIIMRAPTNAVAARINAMRSLFYENMNEYHFAIVCVFAAELFMHIFNYYLQK